MTYFLFSTLNSIFSECYFMNMAAKISQKLLVHTAPNFQDKYIIPKSIKQHGVYVNFKPK